MVRETLPNNGTPAVAVWLSAINIAKAGIARLIITIHREGSNAAILDVSAFDSARVGLQTKVRAFHWLGVLGTHPAPPSSRWWEAQGQSPSERLQVIYRIEQMMYGFTRVNPTKIHSNKHETLTTIFREISRNACEFRL